MAKTKYNKIKTALIEADKQNADLAEYMKVHITTVSDWYTNTNQPSIQDLFKISKFLKINVRKLLVPTDWENNPMEDADDDLKIKNTKSSPRKNAASSKRNTRTIRK